LLAWFSFWEQSLPLDEVVGSHVDVNPVFFYGFCCWEQRGLCRQLALVLWYPCWMLAVGCHYIGLLSSAGCDLSEVLVVFTHIVVLY